MLTTYPATLRDNVLEWLGAVPGHIAPGQAVEVRVTLEEPQQTALSNGPLMAEALEKIAELGGLDNVDPALWEREVRLDRRLVGRDE